MANSTGDEPSAPAHRLGPDEAAYVDTVRRATARLGREKLAPDDVRGALAAVGDVARFDVEPPATGRRPEVRAVKTAVKRLSAWYLRYLAAQLDAFALSVLRAGDALATRTEQLESSVGGLDARLGAVEDRLGRMEERGPAG